MVGAGGAVRRQAGAVALLLAASLADACAAPAPALPLPLAEPAAMERLRIDSAKTRVDFSVRLMFVRRVSGRFPLVEGDVTVRRDGGEADVDVRIDAREVMMSRPSWSEWARSPEFFDAARHPWIRFQARAVPLDTFQQGGALRGLLTLRGNTREVELELLPSHCEVPGRHCPVRARGELERSDFGMNARRVAVGDKVRLDFEIRVHPASDGVAP